MSTLEIAELTDKEHRNVMRDTRKMLMELHGEGGLLTFEHTHRNPQNGQDYPVYRLPKRESLILVSGYSVELRARIIDRWMELEEAVAKMKQRFGRRFRADTLRPTRGDAFRSGGELHSGSARPSR